MAELRHAPALSLCHPNTADCCMASAAVSGIPQEFYIHLSGKPWAKVKKTDQDETAMCYLVMGMPGLCVRSVAAGQSP